MITIVIVYFNRQVQLDKTLESLCQYNPDDFNVVIVNNASDKDIISPELPYDVRLINLTDKTFINPVIAYNIGYLEALKDKPDIIITQHSECYHIGDILDYAKQADKSYISFGCYSLGRGENPETVTMNDRSIKIDGESAWYNHPIYRPVGYNFCSAISAENLIKLNGFDERFQFGLAYEDDYFLHQIRILGLKIEITSYPFVFHQWHSPCPTATWPRNAAIYKELIKNKEYKAKHLYTSDL